MAVIPCGHSKAFVKKLCLGHQDLKQFATFGVAFVNRRVALINKFDEWLGHLRQQHPLLASFINGLAWLLSMSAFVLALAVFVLTVAVWIPMGLSKYRSVALALAEGFEWIERIAWVVFLGIIAVGLILTVIWMGLWIAGGINPKYDAHKKSFTELLEEFPIIGFPVGCLWLVGISLSLVLVFMALERYTLLLAAVWLVVPVSACLMNHSSVSASFTLKGLKQVQAILMIIVVVISIFMCLSILTRPDVIRNPIGKRFVAGYRTWQEEPDVGYEPVDKWTAATSSGKWGLILFELAVFAAGFAFPAITREALRKAISKRKADDIQAGIFPYDTS
jgi:hypothetical protein